MKLAQDMKKIQIFTHVSTCYVNCNLKGLIREEIYDGCTIYGYFRIGSVSVVWEIVGHVDAGFGCQYGTDFGNLSQYLYLYQGIVLKINQSTKGKSYCFDSQAGYHQYQLSRTISRMAGQYRCSCCLFHVCWSRHY